MIGYLRRPLTELYAKRLRDRIDAAQEPPVPLEAVVEYIVSSLIGIVRWGLERSQPQRRSNSTDGTGSS